MFMPPGDAARDEYRAFWAALARGEFQAGALPPRAPDGATVWLQASYNPVLDRAGRVARIDKFAHDITAQVRRDADVGSQLSAIDRSMAVIEFALDGTILRANDNFLAPLGYAADEVDRTPPRHVRRRRHARIDEYRAFWTSLNAGDFTSAVSAASARAGARCGSKRATTPCSTTRACRAA